MSATIQEPKGVPFFSIESGDTHYARLEPQIQAYINSSDMGINASRGQDKGWRLGKEWVHKVREFQQNEEKMERLMAKNGGQDPTTPQILYAIYGEQVRGFMQRRKAAKKPFEQEYLRDIQDDPQPEEEVRNANQSTTTNTGTESPAEPSEEKHTASTSNKPAHSSEKPAKVKPGKTER